MWIDKHREVIESNVFDIPQRLREIDADYFVVYNHAIRQFEVHHSGQDETYCLSVPYPELDARTLHRVRETRVERAEEIWEQIQKDNLKRELESSKYLDNEVTPKLKEIHRYVKNHESKETIPDDAYTTKFV